MYVKGSGLSALIEVQTRHYDHEFTEILLKCDAWEGALREYDLVTDYWPLVPERLFNQLHTAERTASKVPGIDRAIVLHKMGNGITSVAAQEPCFVSPRHGLYRESQSHWRRQSLERLRLRDLRSQTTTIGYLKSTTIAQRSR